MKKNTTKRRGMERITFHIQSSKKRFKLVYRLRDGRDVQITHKTDIVVDLSDLSGQGTSDQHIKVSKGDCI